MYDQIPVEHTVDQDKHLIITTWRGEASDDTFISALTRYQQQYRTKSRYSDYNELLDFRHLDASNLTTTGLIELGKIARQTDSPDTHTKLAIVVSSAIAFGLSQMYISYRNLLPESNKSLRVFREKEPALLWLTEKAP